jgi:hypothetical protein
MFTLTPFAFTNTHDTRYAHNRTTTTDDSHSHTRSLKTPASPSPNVMPNPTGVNSWIAEEGDVVEMGNDTPAHLYYVCVVIVGAAVVFTILFAGCCPCRTLIASCTLLSASSISLHACCSIPGGIAFLHRMRDDLAALVDHKPLTRPH